MKSLSTAVFILIAASACMHNKSATGPTAVATLESRSGSTAAGTVRFTQLPDGGVVVRVDVTGVTPGVHGFHVHEKGDCSAADAASAGPHFNPASAPHGGPGDGSHAGDFGNLTATAAGEIHAEMKMSSITVTEGANSVVGRAVVLHADPDDLTSQPAGNAGKRIGCGVAVLWSGSAGSM